MVTPDQPRVPREICDEVALYLRRSFAGIFPKRTDFAKLADDVLNPARSSGQMHVLQDIAGPLKPGAKFLEVGSGFGALVVLLRVCHAVESFGVEPPENEFLGTLELSKKLLAANHLPQETIVEGFGEELPFTSRSFDIVYSSNVLEHVNDPGQVLSEAVRVTKPGGYIQFVFPNYGSFWEGHYGLFWFPNLSKRLGELYVRLWGRSPEMIRSLHLLNRRDVEEFVRQVSGRAEVLGTGRKLWAERLRASYEFEYAFLGKMKRAVSLVHKTGLVELVIKTGLRYHWETPFVLTLRRS